MLAFNVKKSDIGFNSILDLTLIENDIKEFLFYKVFSSKFYCRCINDVLFCLFWEMPTILGDVCGQMVRIVD